MDESLGMGALIAMVVGALVRAIPKLMEYRERRAMAREREVRAVSRAELVVELVKAGETPAAAAKAANAVFPTDDTATAARRPAEGET